MSANTCEIIDCFNSEQGQFISSSMLEIGQTKLRQELEKLGDNPYKDFLILLILERELGVLKWH